ncbi:MAG: RNA methyltransferase [Rhodocyclaceae bacterium]|nr:RNA methyltransferase [Rhodocyclaceae bacterium]
MRIRTFIQRLRAAGAKPCHEDALLRMWVRAVGSESGHGRPDEFFPTTLRYHLPAWRAQCDGLVRMVSRHPAEDASERLLLALADGRTIESVLLPRGGLCVSTQVGCAVGCTFCMTGRDGLLRQLGSAEIVAQLALARRFRAVSKVVFMGMGEPAHNLDNVFEAIELIAHHGAIAHKNLVVSTVGDRRLFERLARTPVRPALALSLHTTKAALRRELLPRAAELAPSELVDLAEAYARLSRYPVQVQWTLIEGVNDGDDEVEALVDLLAGKYMVLNLIPVNRVDGGTLRRPSAERAAAMSLALYRRGVLTKLRDSAGQQVDAGCGQLRARQPVIPLAPLRPIETPATPRVS